MVNCWADVLGNCSRVQSLEHTVSQSVFSTKIVKVHGFSWCKDEKEIGLSSLGSNILCSTHNSALSELDTAAGKLMDSLEYATELNQRRQKQKPRKWSVHKKMINGPLFERWILKTLVNLAHTDAKNAVIPFAEIVETVFGLRSFRNTHGLYSTSIVGENINISRTVSFQPLWQHDKLIAGIYRFGGFEFVLAPGNVRSYFHNKNYVFHRKRIKFLADKYPSMKVHFEW